MAKHNPKIIKSVQRINRHLTNQNKKNISIRTFKKYSGIHKRNLRLIKIRYGSKIYDEALCNQFFALTLIDQLRWARARKKK